MSDIVKAVSVLRAGGVVIFPTDTVYGMGCAAIGSDAEEKISRAKGRDPHKRVAWLFSDLERAKAYVEIPDNLSPGLMRIWPGALTGIFFRKGKKGTIGIRIPNYDIVRDLIDELGFPIVTSSLNMAGKPPVMKSSELRGFAADYVIDGGDLPKRPASTVVDFTQIPYIILRVGSITKKDLEEIFGEEFHERQDN